MWNDVARDTLGDVERLQHLTDDLLTLARIDNDPEPHHEPVDLRVIVIDALQAMRRPDVRLTTTGLDTPAIVDGGVAELRRMVRNLLHNAEDHAAANIDIALGTAPGTIHLTVADDGPGIPIADRQQVFERFVRLDTARTRDSGGSGLGLAIVHDVVAGHQGTITITDSEPHGATFRVELPVCHRRDREE